MTRQNPLYTVGQISHYIKDLFARDFLLRTLSVEGEVCNLKYHSSGHIYFTLKDETAQIAAVMFAGSRASGLNFRLENGQSVICTGMISVYERDGKYQLYVRSCEQSGTGELYRRFLQLKDRLDAEGLFLPEHKKKIPPYAFRIGIVTASTGAALQDIRNIAARRNPSVSLILCPALVQGSGAAPSIVSGIRTLARMGLDVIIVGRGGGSAEDLWAFNEEIVARAIYEAETPIISAVGHETDFTIADFAADLRAPTPSAAAELAVFDRSELASALDQKSRLLHLAADRKLYDLRHVLTLRRRELDRRSPETRLAEQKHRLAMAAERIGQIPRIKTEEARRHLTLSGDRLRVRMRSRMDAAAQAVRIRAAALEGRSPLARLSGGFVYAETADSRPLRSVRSAGPGDSIRLTLTDGELLTEVREVIPSEEER